jgi:YrbI family 3-deoxy-D-manno-octulosonate 8-phosphate phosphatase
MLAPELLAKLRQVRLLISDVDGTLTDGALYYSSSGDELRRFHVHDGLGIELLHLAGIRVVFLSKETSEAIRLRAQKLRANACYLGVKDKAATTLQIAKQYHLELSHVAYIGDDLTDLPAMRLVGVCACPADAVAAVREYADYVCSHPGGNGAVREFCELIVNAHGLTVEQLLQVGHTSYPQ